MDNMQDTIAGILSDPTAMEKIKELGKSLGLTSDEPKDTPAPSEEKPHSENTDSIDLSSLSSLISGITPRKEQSSPSIPDPNTLSTLKKFLPLLSTINQEDETSALLYALRPFLSEHKRKRLDDAGKMLKVMRVLPMIRSTGLF